MKKLYAIGTGPSQEDLITLRSLNLIKGASLIFAPLNKGKNMALDTIKDYIDGKKIVYLDYPMGRCTEETYRENLKIIYDSMEDDSYSVFITIGDATVYSTFVNTLKVNNYEDLIIDFSPGIPSFLAAANILKEPLTEMGESFILTDNFKEEMLDICQSIAILKTYRDKTEILDALDKKGFSYSYISNISQENQKILTSREDILKEENYMSLILANKRG